MLLRIATVTSFTTNEIELEHKSDPVAGALSFGGAVLDEAEESEPISLKVGWSEVMLGDYRVTHIV